MSVPYVHGEVMGNERRGGCHFGFCAVLRQCQGVQSASYWHTTQTALAMLPLH